MGLGLSVWFFCSWWDSIMHQQSAARLTDYQLPLDALSRMPWESFISLSKTCSHGNWKEFQESYRKPVKTLEAQVSNCHIILLYSIGQSYWSYCRFRLKRKENKFHILMEEAAKSYFKGYAYRQEWRTVVIFTIYCLSI